MSSPSKELERLLTCVQLRHDGNPCLRWNVGNVAAKQDAAGNLKPDKSESTGRIDGVVSIVMGLGRATLARGPSVYETRGVLVLTPQQPAAAAVPAAPIAAQ